MFSRSVFARRSLIAFAAIFLTASVAKAADPVLSGSAPARAAITRTLWVGNNDNYVVVVGDHSTDLDCRLYQDGMEVSSDLDTTDICILRSPGVGVHEVQITNLGYIYNNYTIYRARSLADVRQLLNAL